MFSFLGQKNFSMTATAKEKELKTEEKVQNAQQKNFKTKGTIISFLCHLFLTADCRTGITIKKQRTKKVMYKTKLYNPEKTCNAKQVSASSQKLACFNEA